MTEAAVERTPSVSIDLGRIAPVGTHWADMDAVREAHRVFWHEHGKHWVLTRAEDIHEAGHDTATFSNYSIIPSEPEPDYRFIPSHLDPPEHVKYRHLMNAWFSPAHVARSNQRLRDVAAHFVDEIAPTGGGEFMATFGSRYPVSVLLASLGLPPDDGPQLVERVRRRSRLRSAGDIDGSMKAWHEMEAYWKATLEDRRSSPRDPDTDFVSHLLRSAIDGAPVPDVEMINIMVTLTIGGIDTTGAQLGWSIYHFATHPDDRRRVVADPSLIPGAVEEILRAYSIIGMGRKVTRDIDFHGCPMRKGDMVLLWYPSACRDPRLFPDADTVRIDREGNRHVAFGSSPHRCVGSHLARAELVAALTEWHRRIPDYEVATDEPLMAIGGQIALLSLPLTWSRA